jgi:hypothetical protein
MKAVLDGRERDIRFEYRLSLTFQGAWPQDTISRSLNERVQPLDTVLTAKKISSELRQLVTDPLTLSRRCLAQKRSLQSLSMSSYKKDPCKDMPVSKNGGFMAAKVPRELMCSRWW